MCSVKFVVSQLRKLTVIVSLSLATLVVPTSVSAREAGSLTADPNFSIEALSPEGKLWYDRQVSGYRGTRYIDPVVCSQSGDTYAIGRCVGTEINALSAAIRVTGDPQFVENVAELMANLRSSLKDVWPECDKFDNCAKMSDGYLNFTWKNDVNSSYYGSDWHEMDEQMAHAAVSNGARILKANTALHPEYQAEVDYWVDYLEKHYLRKNMARRGINVDDTSVENYNLIINRGISHPDIARVSLFYDLYVLTDNPIYLEVANRKNEVMRQTYRPVTFSDGTPAMVWRHYSGTKKTNSVYDTYCQLVEYGSYDLHYVWKLHNDGFNDYASEEMMQRFTNTITHAILDNSDPATTLIGTVCGRQSYTFPEYTILFDSVGSERNRPFARWANYWSYHAFARWDDSGKIYESSDIAFKQWDTAWEQPGVDLKNPGLGGMVLWGLGDKAYLTAETPAASPSVPPIEQEPPTPPVVEYPEIQAACSADVDDNGFVDLSDLFLLNQSIRDNNNNLDFDLNHDQVLDQSDVDTLLPLFFSQCQM